MLTGLGLHKSEQEKGKPFVIHHRIAAVGRSDTPFWRSLSRTTARGNPRSETDRHFRKEDRTGPRRNRRRIKGNVHCFQRMARI